MSSFYEVTAASGTAAAGDDSTRRHRYGRLSRESSRRPPHPHGGVGRRRGRLLYSPYGLATKATGQPHAHSPAATTTLHRGRPTGSRGVLRACGPSVQWFGGGCIATDDPSPHPGPLSDL